jgi:hypothetical protein
MLSLFLCSLAAAAPVILVGPSGLIQTHDSDVATPLLDKNQFGAMGLKTPIIEKYSDPDLVRRHYNPGGCWRPPCWY